MYKHYLKEVTKDQNISKLQLVNETSKSS